MQEMMIKNLVLVWVLQQMKLLIFFPIILVEEIIKMCQLIDH